MIKLWKLADPSHPDEITVDSYQVNIDQPKHCSISTMKLENERMKTVVLLASSSKMVLLDRNLKLIKEFEGVIVDELFCFGASRRAVFGILNGGKLSVWDFTKLANEQEEYVSA